MGINDPIFLKSSIFEEKIQEQTVDLFDNRTERPLLPQTSHCNDAHACNNDERSMAEKKLPKVGNPKSVQKFHISRARTKLVQTWKNRNPSERKLDTLLDFLLSQFGIPAIGVVAECTSVTGKADAYASILKPNKLYRSNYHRNRLLFPIFQHEVVAGDAHRRERTIEIRCPPFPSPFRHNIHNPAL